MRKSSPNLIGQKFGRLLVIDKCYFQNENNKYKAIKWRCLCDCGNETFVATSALTHGHTKSCGCWNIEAIRQRNTKDIADQRFGRLVALYNTGKQSDGKFLWHCKCDCGNEVDVKLSSLTSGRTKSCGCLAIETKQNNRVTHGYTRGRKIERLYRVWYMMKDRCNNSNNKDYDKYGGRGISVCDEWQHNYSMFRGWALTNGYNPDANYADCTLDRIDNDGNYCPENCRWVSQAVQGYNRRTNILMTYHGETHSMKEWAKILNMPYGLIRSRYRNYGWSVEDTFEIPSGGKRNEFGSSSRT